MSTATTRAPSVVISLVLVLLIAACGEPSTIADNRVCRDSLAGICRPCAGVDACVDPVACVVVPCQGDASIPFGGADGSGDDTAGLGDATVGDTAASDAGTTTDATGHDAAAKDAADNADVPTDTSTACAPGAKRCAGDSVEICLFGSWQVGEACPSGQTCDEETLACGCTHDCVAIGQTRCLAAGVPAVETCEVGADGCLAWSLPVACAPGASCTAGVCSAGGCVPACAAGTSCVSGQCVDDAPCVPACGAGAVCLAGQCVAAGCNPPCAAGQVCTQGACVAEKPCGNGCAPGEQCVGGTCVGTQSCLQIANCVLTACQPGDPNCTAKCLTKGTLAAQQTYTAMTDCGKLGCKALVDAGKGNEAMLCLYTVCGAERGACLGSGAGTCADLANCLASCGDSVVCQQGCHGQVSDQGAKDYYTLLTCADQKCSGLALEQKASCAQQSCPLFDTCFGAATGGALTCQGILQCASLCGSSKACAQQCKGQGSAAAQQQLDTLISCNDLNCAAYCNAGNAQLCDFCYSQCVQASGCT